MIFGFSNENVNKMSYVMTKPLTRIMSLSTKTDRSSEMRRTLQIRIRALNRNRYRSLHFPSLSVTVNQSWNINTQIKWTVANLMYITSGFCWRRQ